MKKLILIFTGVFLITGCGESQVPIPKVREQLTVTVSSENPALTAYSYYGLHEQYDRQELANLVGVDPLRTEWCAAFVNSVLNESGIAGSESVSEHPLLARSFLQWGTPVESQDILPGDLVIFPRGNSEWQGHVGFYLRSINNNGKELYFILGGNQSNKVSVQSFSATNVLGIRRHKNF